MKLLKIFHKTYIIEMNFDADGRNKFLQVTVTISNKHEILMDMVDTVKQSYPDAINIKIEKIFRL